MDRIWLEKTLEETEGQIDLEHGSQMQTKSSSVSAPRRFPGGSSNLFAVSEQIPVGVVNTNKAACKIRAATR
jgi:hypothetical protein